MSAPLLHGDPQTHVAWHASPRAWPSGTDGAITAEWTV